MGLGGQGKTEGFLDVNIKLRLHGSNVGDYRNKGKMAFVWDHFQSF